MFQSLWHSSFLFSYFHCTQTSLSLTAERKRWAAEEKRRSVKVGRSWKRKEKVRESFFSLRGEQKKKGKGGGNRRDSISPPSVRNLSLPPLAIGISPSPDWLGGGGGSFCLSRSPTTVNPRKESRRVCPRAGRGRKIPSSCLLPAQSSPEFVGQCGPSAQPSTSKAEARKKRVAA